MNNQLKNSFLPADYQPPKTNSRYLKLEQGDNLIRILGDAIIGWLDWWEDGAGNRKPVRTRYNEKPEPFKADKPVKHFWAFPCWDYREHAVKIYEITQATIQNAILDLHNDADWGSPTQYDIGIKKTGEKMETKYSVIAKPPKTLHPDIAKIWAETKLDLNALYDGKDPWGGDNATSTQKPLQSQDLSPQVDTNDIEAGLNEVFGDVSEEPPTPSERMMSGFQEAIKK